MAPTRSARLYPMLVVLSLLWGLAFVGIKEGLRELSPSTLTILRFAVADVCLLIIVAAVPSARPRFTRHDFPRIAVLGLCGIPGYHLALNWGERRTSASVASIIIASAPVMVALLSSAALRERSTATRWVGIALAFGGVALLSVSGSSNGGHTDVKGALVVALAALAWAVYTVVAKPITARASSVQVTTATMLTGSIALLPFLSGRVTHEIAGLSASGWAWMIMLGAGASVAGYFIFVWALSKMEATKVAVFLYAVPIVAIVSARLFLDEPLGWRIVISAVLVIAGVVLAQQERVRARPVEALPVEEPVA